MSILWTEQSVLLDKILFKRKLNSLEKKSRSDSESPTKLKSVLKESKEVDLSDVNKYIIKNYGSFIINLPEFESTNITISKTEAKNRSQYL